MFATCTYKCLIAYNDCDYCMNGKSYSPLLITVSIPTELLIRPSPEEVGMKHWKNVPFIDKSTTGMVILRPLDDVVNGCGISEK